MAVTALSGLFVVAITMLAMIKQSVSNTVIHLRPGLSVKYLPNGQMAATASVLAVSSQLKTLLWISTAM